MKENTIKRTLGNCELYCGDCFDIIPLVGAVDCIITDPPYCSGGRQNAVARNIIAKNGRDDTNWFLGDNMGVDTYIFWFRSIGKKCLDITKNGGAAYVFTDWRQYANVISGWEIARWGLHNVIVWDKAKGGAMGSAWRSNHEWVCYFTKGKAPPFTRHDLYNTWQGRKPNKGNHPTEKPVELIEYILQAVAKDAVICDPFMGSGTTAIACINTGRKFIGIEIDEGFYDTACKRIEKALAIR
jgi:site-specific DNA-methyltransferase (adenine-specific)